MTVSYLPLPEPKFVGASEPPCQTEPIKVVPKPREHAPMNARVMSHVHADTEISAVQDAPNSSVQLTFGSTTGGAEITLFLHDNAEVMRLIEALRAVYPS